MGRILQIRVSAWTYGEDLAERAWPNLWELAFSVPIKHEKRGVLEMVTALGDGIKFMGWPEARVKALKGGLDKCLDIKKRLENALADWDPRKAQALSEELETVLDAMEQNFK